MVRGTWDDVNRRLTSATLALDLDDSLVIGDRLPAQGRGLFARKPAPRPRRFVQITAARSVLIGECVGSRSFGGEWEMSEETERALLRQGWQKPWSEDMHTFQREESLMRAPHLVLATVRALRLLGCEVAELDVQLVREEP